MSWSEEGVSKNFEYEFVLPLPDRRKPPKVRVYGTPRVVEAVALARQYRAALTAGEASNQRALAQAHQVSQYFVGRMLSLLALEGPILEYVEGLCDTTPPRAVTVQHLRALVRLPAEQRLEAARANLNGFEAWLRATKAT